MAELLNLPLNSTVGGRDLCAWQPVKGITWVQTREPGYATRLARRLDGRLVVKGVGGGFLRTFEFKRPLSWAVALIERYTRNENDANATSGRAICPQAGFSDRA